MEPLLHPHSPEHGRRHAGAAPQEKSHAFCFVENSRSGNGGNGIAAPLATPKAITLKLNAAVNRVLQNPDAVRRLQELGLEVLGGTPEDAERFVQREAGMVQRLIKLGKIRPE